MTIPVTFGVLLGISMFAYEINFRGTILPRVLIDGQDVSGVTAEGASDLIKYKTKNQGLILILRDNKQREKRVKTDDFELSYNIPETISKAWLVGRRGTIVEQYKERISSLVRPKEISLVVNFDKSALEVSVASIAAEMNIDPVMAKLAVRHEPNNRKQIIFTQGENGLVVDQDRLLAAIERSLNKTGTVLLDIPVEVIKARVDTQRVEKIKEMARNWADKEMTLRAPNYSKTISSDDLVAMIGLSDVWQEEKIQQIANSVAHDLNREPVDARFEFKEEKLADFAPETEGIEVNEAALVKDIETAVTAYQETVNIQITTTPAKIKAGEVNNLGIQQLLGKGKSTYFHSIPGRVHNVSLAASKINGVIIPPGETFSFNNTIGDISAATGYQTAYIIKDGKTVLGDGGGVCQVSTTLFRAVLKTGLPIVERQAHAYRVGYYEQDSKPGIDATVFAPSVDLKFTNDTARHLLIQAKADPGKFSLGINIYGTYDDRKVTLTEPRIFSQTTAPADLYVDDPTLPAGQIRQIDFKANGAKVGFDYKVVRNDQITFQKTFYSNYQPWQAVYLRGTK